MAVEILLWGNEFLKGVYIHAFRPVERTRKTAVPDILVAVADADAMMQSVPVGIVLAVVGGAVPYLAVGKAGVVHLVDYGQT